MKKIVFIILSITYLFSIYLSFQQTNNEQIKEFAALETESEFTHPFIIPENISFDNPEKIYSIIIESANESEVNILRGARYYRTDEQIEYIKYMYLTRETSLFNKIKLENGRLPNKNDNDKDYIITSSSDGNQNQIGSIKTLSSKLHFSVKPFIKSFEVLPYSGRYFVEADDTKKDQFLESLTQNLNLYLDSQGSKENTVTTSDLQPPEAFETLNKDIIITYDLYSEELSRNIILSLGLLFLIYYIFSQSKQIGIIKLNGISNMTIWWLIIGKIITLTVFLSIVIGIIAAVLLKLPFAYWSNMFIEIGLTYAILIILSTVCYFFISKINIAAVIKKKKNTNWILRANYFVKIILAVLILLVSMETLQKYTNLSDERDKLQNENNQHKAEKLEYGIFQAYMGYTTAHNFKELEKEFLLNDQALYRLYPRLNELGSLYIDATQYEEENLVLNKNYSGIIAMTVNINYLNKYPVLDLNGEVIKLEEKDNDWIILIPEQFQHEESEIRNYYEESRGFFIAKEENQNIKIIWTKEGQSSYTMNPDVFPKSNNYIQDPVIHVKTLNNHLFVYRGGITGSGIKDPMKVKLTNTNSAFETFDLLRPELVQLNLDKSSKLSSIDQFITDNIDNQSDTIRVNILALIGFSLLYLFVSVQNVIINFHNKSKEYVVKYLFGISYFKTYRSAFISMLLTYISVVVLTLIANNGRLLTDTNLIPDIYSSSFLIVIFLILVIEILTTTISIIVVERRNKLKIIKSEL